MASAAATTSYCAAAAAAAAAASWSYGSGDASKQKMVLSANSFVVVRTPKIVSNAIWSGSPRALKMERTSTPTPTTETKKKMAKLYVKKRQTVPLPTFSDASGKPQPLNVFLREPAGRQCMLNTKALRKYENVGDGVFKCYLPTMEFLSFEVSPIIDLLVDANEDSCQVDLLACKFEGSNLIRSQNERFSASLKNHLSWSSTQQELHVRLELNVSLEVYTLPFTLLPISAVESPGTLILQALVDRLLPLFLEQLFADYQAWAESQISISDEMVIKLQE